MQLELVGGVKTKQDEGVYVQTATCYIVGMIRGALMSRRLHLREWTCSDRLLASSSK
jgi:hypothetical protein